MSIDEAIATAELMLPGIASAADTVDNRWQAIITIGEFIKSNPNEVWEFSARWGRSDDEDLRTAVATCLLEHLLEYHFDLIFPRLESLAAVDRNFADACLACWELGLSEQPENAQRLRSLQSRIRRAA